MDIRNRLIDSIAKRILCSRLEHPMRIGIDGITASGKSTFAKELYERLSLSGRRCNLTTLDGFHNPKSVRYQKGRESAQGYYLDAYNYEQVLKNLLLPLGPQGNLQYRTKTHDLKTDEAIEMPFISANLDEILIVDGSFALRKELKEHWDFKIYIKVEFEIAQSRAAVRDADYFGSSEKALEVTRIRYHGAHLIHNELATPWLFADVVINNDRPENPVIEKQRRAWERETLTEETPQQR